MTVPKQSTQLGRCILNGPGAGVARPRRRGTGTAAYGTAACLAADLEASRRDAPGEANATQLPTNELGHLLIPHCPRLGRDRHPCQRVPTRASIWCSAGRRPASARHWRIYCTVLSGSPTSSATVGCGSGSGSANQIVFGALSRIADLTARLPSRTRQERAWRLWISRT